MSTTGEGNVGVALALVFGAGAATSVGASVVFFPSLVKLASRRVLAASLGLSAGVMIYISFVEIFAKCLDAFAQYLGVEEEGLSDEAVEEKENTAFVYAVLSFFGGVVVMLIIDGLVKYLSGEHHHQQGDTENVKHDHDENGDEQEVIAPHCVGCSDDPVRELNEWQQRAELELQGRGMARARDNDTSFGTPYDFESSSSGSGRITPPRVDNGSSEGGNITDSFRDDNNESNSGGNENRLVVVDTTPADSQHEFEKKKLVKMGLSTAVAIAIHNFPEGLATFVAALDDPSVGAVLAIAIGIHNIPEGLCVALPIYYATGNRWKAFLWGSFSGISEPVAALLGWAILAKAITQDVYGVLFGLVSGMMVIISLKELIPTAHRYDPEDTVVTYSLIAGMVIMALSLVLFKL